MFPRLNNESVDRFIFCSGTLPPERGQLLKGLHQDITDKIGRIGDSVNKTWLVSGDQYVVAVELMQGRSPGWAGYRLESYMRQHGLSDIKILNYREAQNAFSKIEEAS